jgi:formylglycine-generating enzyme required for sulfatase activity
LRVGAALRTVKGGSFLCAANYCARYRPAARIPQAEDGAASNIGFRCAASAPRKDK